MKLKIQKNTRTSSAIGRREEAGRQRTDPAPGSLQNVGTVEAWAITQRHVLLTWKYKIGFPSGMTLALPPATTTPGIGRGTATDVVHVEKSSSSSSSSTRMTDLKVGILVYLMIFLHLSTTNSPTASTIGCIFFTR